MTTTAEQIELTFDHVEAILGTPLPKSTTKLTTWWFNVQPKIQSHRATWLTYLRRVIDALMKGTLKLRPERA
jgi:hypothetical protein